MKEQQNPGSSESLARLPALLVLITHCMHTLFLFYLMACFPSQINMYSIQFYNYYIESFD
jgi:hypothetical protein